ncbi:MAG: flagellar protein [Lachnospiraceae bacterium]|nr:flagellar protein [Lachnospiraceae bacterium]
MNVRNCRNCGQLFNYIAGAFLCQRCKEEMEVKFQEVKEYIRKYPGVSIPQVSEACDVDPAQIRQWLREDRLEVTEDSPIFLNCDSCGKPIRSGKYCEQCKYEVTSGFKSILNEGRKSMQNDKNTSTKSSAKMRYL